MIAIRKILVPTDYSVCAEGALMHGLHLARHYGAEVHLLHVEEGAASGYAMPVSRFRTHAAGTEASVERWNDVLLRRVVQHHPDATSAILAYARRQDVDLIVMGTHGNQSVDRFLSDLEDHWPIGMTAEQVIKLADRPVFTVGPRSSRMPDLVRRVLMPVDFSLHARRAMAYAYDLAGRYGAGLHFLHVLPPEKAGEAGEAERRLEMWVNLGEGEALPRTCQVRTGDPADVILDVAARDARTIIVISSHGQRGIEQHRLGSEAERIIRAAPCPVFTDKAFGRSLLRLPAGGGAVRRTRSTPTATA